MSRKLQMLNPVTEQCCPWILNGMEGKAELRRILNLLNLRGIKLLIPIS